MWHVSTTKSELRIRTYNGLADPAFWLLILFGVSLLILVFEITKGFLSGWWLARTPKWQTCTGRALDEHWMGIGGALEEHPRIIGGAFEEHWRSIGGALEKHWRSTRGALEEHCRSIGGSLEEHRWSTRGALEDHWMSMDGALAPLMSPLWVERH